jgi:hypothetical protein
MVVLVKMGEKDLSEFVHLFPAQAGLIQERQDKDPFLQHRGAGENPNHKGMRKSFLQRFRKPTWNSCNSLPGKKHTGG